MLFWMQFLVMGLLLSCDPSPQAIEADREVLYAGALRSIMHQGDVSVQMDLADLKDRAHLYALGAVEDLKGEILILDGQPWISSVQDSALSLSSSFDKGAVLLVWTEVDQWKDFPVPDSVRTYADLERYVFEQAAGYGIDTDKPFPFLLGGLAESFNWHVIDWPDGDSVHTHQKHVESGMNGQMENQLVDILGFYSTHHHAVFTHHSTNMHLHVKTRGHVLAGHLDDLTLGEGMVLRLPEQDL